MHEAIAGLKDCGQVQETTRSLWILPVPVGQLYSGTNVQTASMERRLAYRRLQPHQRHICSTVHLQTHIGHKWKAQAQYPSMTEDALAVSGISDGYARE